MYQTLDLSDKYINIVDVLYSTDSDTNQEDDLKLSECNAKNIDIDKVRNDWDLSDSDLNFDLSQSKFKNS